MASAKEYNMLFKLQAQLGREFTSTFNNAQQVLQQTQAKIRELNSQQADISAFQKQQQAVENTARKLRDLQKEHDNIQREIQETEGYSSALENKLIEKQRAIDNTSKSLERQTEKLNQQREALHQSGIDTDHLTDESNRLTSELEDLAKKEQEVTEEAKKYQNKGVAAFEAVGSALVAAGIAEGLKAIFNAYTDCVKISADFQESMSGVEALSGASADEMGELSEKAKELGATTKFTAKEAADAMNYMGMAGWNAQQIIGGIDGVMSLAAASGEDLAMTSDIVTDALTAFQMKAEDASHFADVLAVTSSKANTNVSMMGETFKYVAPVAGAMRYSIEDTAEAIGLMANAGIKSSDAGTSLRSVITRLSTDAGASANQLGALGVLTQKLGVQFYEADGSARDLNDVLNEARQAWKGLTEEEATNYANTIAGKNAISGWLALMNAGTDDVNKLHDAISAADGAAQEMAAIRLDNFNGQVTLMNSAMDALKTTVGEAFQEELTDLAKIATELLTDTNQFLKDNPILLKGILLFGGALTTIVGAYTAYNTVKKVSNALKVLGAALTTNETAAEVEDTAATLAHNGALGGETAATTGATGATTAHTAALKASALQMGALIAVASAVVAEFAYFANVIWGVSDAVKETQNETKGIIDAMEESIAKSQAEMSMLKTKVEVYDELRLKENKTVEEQQRLAKLAGELQDVFGDEVEVVNSLTGEYNDLSAAVDNYVEKKMRRAKMSAQEEAAEKAYTQIAEIQRKMEERAAQNGEDMKDTWLSWIPVGMDFVNMQVHTVDELRKNTQEYSFINDMAAYREEIAKCQKVIDDYEASLRDEAGTTDDVSEKTGNLTIVSHNLNAALMAVETGYLDVATAAEQYGVSADKLSEAMQSASTYKSALQNAAGALKQGYLSAEEAAKQYGVTVEALDIYDNVETAITTIEALAHAYDEALEAAQKSVEGQYKLWDDAAAIVAQDIDAINASLMSQNEYWQEYEANISALTEKANDIEGLREIIATFADGSPESANMIAGLAQASDEDLKLMVENWQAVQEEQSKTAEGLAELTTGAGARTEELKGTLNEVVDNLNLEDEASAAAKASIDAYIKALQGGEEEAVAAASRISTLVAAALNPNTQATATYGTGNGLMSIDELIADAQFVGPRLPADLTGAYADGTSGADPGLALVGEKGPELVIFNGGEQVIPASETRALMNEMRGFYSVNEYASGTGNSALNGSENAVATANAVYYEILSFVPLVNYIAQYLEEMRSAVAYDAERRRMIDTSAYTEQLPFDSSGQGTVITVAPVFNVQGGGDELEMRLREFSDELVERVMDALEEAEIDTRRRSYK